MKESPQIIVRQCRQQDVAVLERYLPTGPNRYHEARYRRQHDGLSTFLLAYARDVPVGADGCRFLVKEISAHPA
ncbi:hypothetical protein [Catellatospora vulcania]|uniref:hypothetical protein n=1 Tax=Catellatospora vulcania TaxID=1460450 RepID=UPI0012D46D72|nr:hypothetical protein [Catellatospora vulcania]